MKRCRLIGFILQHAARCIILYGFYTNVDGYKLIYTVQEQSLYSKLIGVMIHVMVWAVFALAIFYCQPVVSDAEMPYQFWIKQTAELSLLVIAFYLNSALLVPRLLLRNRLVWYLVIVVAIMLTIVLSQRALEKSYAAYQERSWVLAEEQKHLDRVHRPQGYSHQARCLSSLSPRW